MEENRYTEIYKAYTIIGYRIFNFLSVKELTAFIDLYREREKERDLFLLKHEGINL